MSDRLELFVITVAAANMILVKLLNEGYNPWLLAGSLFFSPGLVLRLQTPGVDWTAPLAFAIVFLGALVTLGAFGLDNWAMRRNPASQASAFINRVPVTAAAIGWLTMG